MNVSGSLQVSGICAFHSGIVAITEINTWYTVFTATMNGMYLVSVCDTEHGWGGTVSVNCENTNINIFSVIPSTNYVMAVVT